MEHGYHGKWLKNGMDPDGSGSWASRGEGLVGTNVFSRRLMGIKVESRAASDP